MFFQHDYQRACPHFFLWIATACLLALSPGCVSSWMTSAEEEIVDDSPADWERSRTVGDLTNPLGMNNAKAQSVALVTSLKNTGGDPPLSPVLDILINEMKVRKVENPNTLLKQPTTAMVLLEAIIPPGSQKGDRIDIKVTAPKGSGTTSLEHGFVLNSRMSEAALLGGRIRTGSTLVMAEGPIIVQAIQEGIDSPAMLTKGMIIGGGVLTKDRPIGLGLKDSDTSIQTSAQIGAAINARFYSYDRGEKKGVATPRDDKYVGLRIHPRYQESVDRFVRVIRFIPLRETTQQRTERIVQLEAELLDPATTQNAALKLEAIGELTIPVLTKGLASTSSLVRFCSAEALIYLEEKSAITTLVNELNDHSEFRYRGFAALNTLNELEVVDQLEKLLNSDSAEVRYGAFDSLRKRGTHITLAKKLDLGQSAVGFKVRSEADPLIHFRLQDRPEMVIFGLKTQVNGKIAIVRPSGMTIRDIDHERVRVSYFAAGEEDRSIVCSRDLSEITKAIVDLGGDYSEIIRILFEMKEQGNLEARLEVDAIAKSNRRYLGENETENSDQEDQVNFDGTDILPEPDEMPNFDPIETNENTNNEEMEKPTESGFGSLF